MKDKNESDNDSEVVESVLTTDVSDETSHEEDFFENPTVGIESEKEKIRLGSSVGGLYDHITNLGSQEEQEQALFSPKQTSTVRGKVIEKLDETIDKDDPEQVSLLNSFKERHAKILEEEAPPKPEITEDMIDSLVEKKFNERKTAKDKSEADELLLNKISELGFENSKEFSEEYPEFRGKLQALVKGGLSHKEAVKDALHLVNARKEASVFPSSSPRRLNGVDRETQEIASRLGMTPERAKELKERAKNRSKAN